MVVRPVAARFQQVPTTATVATIHPAPGGQTVQMPYYEVCGNGEQVSDIAPLIVPIRLSPAVGWTSPGIRSGFRGRNTVDLIVRKCLATRGVAIVRNPEDVSVILCGPVIVVLQVKHAPGSRIGASALLQLP
jgi:hypothetical protein